jgi:hypothetical protein
VSRIPIEPDSLHKQIASAKVSVARHALASPFFFEQGCELVNAREALRHAKHRLLVAEAAWAQLIAPAKGWAPDPLKDPS